MKQYCIRNGYISRSHSDFLNIINEPIPGVIDGRDGSQEKVYHKAQEVAINNNLRNIIDIGCGSGYKLLKYFSGYNTIGTDLNHTIKILRERYPDRRWEVSDFNSDLKISYRTDLIISADVIEHLNDPDEMINWIKNMSPKFVIMSTPDRDTLVREARAKTGPPHNIWHMREWNKAEFENYIGQSFTILEHFNVKQSYYEYQTVVCELK